MVRKKTALAALVVEHSQWLVEWWERNRPGASVDKVRDEEKMAVDNLVRASGERDKNRVAERRAAFKVIDSAAT